MIGILVQLALSWLLLWLVDKKDLTVLGLKPTRDRLSNFIAGFLLTACCFVLYSLAITTLTDNHWSVNDDFTAKQFAASFWWTVNSVMFEELLFRGALLYLVIQKTSIVKGCAISAVAFGVYHWFSFGVLGNPISMVYIFFSTGLWGLMFAFAFARTQSMYLPAGLHLGWNLFNIVIFSQGPLGHQFLISSHNGQLLSGFPSAVLQLFQLFAVPAMVFFYLKRKHS